MGRKEPISKGRHGESFWEEEKHNFGLKMLKKFGWKNGKGLGKEQQGTTKFVRSHLKKDKSGIGSKQPDETFGAATAVFNKLLKKLNNEHNNLIADSPVEEASKKAAGKSTSSELDSFLAGKQLYAKFKRAKDVKNYSDNHLAEIFGVKKSEYKKSDEGKGEEIDQEKSSKSMADYFAEKRKIRKESGFTEDAQENYYTKIKGLGYGGRRGLGFGNDTKNDLLVVNEVGPIKKKKKDSKIIKLSIKDGNKVKKMEVFSELKTDDPKIKPKSKKKLKKRDNKKRKKNVKVVTEVKSDDNKIKPIFKENLKKSDDNKGKKKKRKLKETTVKEKLKSKKKKTYNT